MYVPLACAFGETGVFSGHVSHYEAEPEASQIRVRTNRLTHTSSADNKIFHSNDANFQNKSDK